MLAEMIISRSYVADSYGRDYSTRGTIQADMERASFDRALKRDTAFARRPDARRVVYRD